jgi:hypothetical protein|tara:strand:+ start:47 stop:244 length:198 start_codon:yes stop_codon:yes gene_type:complete
MPKLTNISNGPRGLRTPDGLVMVEPGEEFDGDLAKGEEPSEEWFAKPTAKAAKEAPKPKGDDGKE